MRRRGHPHGLVLCSAVLAPGRVHRCAARSTRGGHLMSAIVRPTLEVVLTESPGFLKRQTDPATGLALIRISP
jgi:hypothetical protein